MAKSAKTKTPEKKPNEIVIEETEDDVVLGNGLYSNPEEFKNLIKKEAERGNMMARFLVPLFTFLSIAGAATFLTYYYAKPEHSIETKSVEEKIQTPPQIPAVPETPATQPAATPTPAPAATTPKTETTYTVQEGDTLSGIANKHDLTSKELADYNALGDVNTLHIGQVLKIPVK